ncbi:MAG TPA: class I SAM-dependent methyltransferase, partial [Methylomirabilota bacterium]|nr:class I SAM-dependent methyltransferase [Methylomirabilota bacterium]
MKHTIEGYRSRLQTPARAQQYAERFEKPSRRRIDRRERSAVRRIFARLPDCATVLDVPSGAGRLASAVGQGRRLVIEMDVAFEILLHARQRAQRDGQRAVMVQADASKLPLVD